MPNLLDASGLETATQAELIAYYTAQYQAIYGPDINLDSDTPDGQIMNINIQAILDLQDLLVQIYNSFDPDNAIGTVLDQRVAINGIQRQAGTYTVTNISVVNSQSVNLYGLDQDTQEVYTVSDNAGNQWQLQTTQLGMGAGTHVLAFQAATPGANLTIPNTITVPVTIVLGVDSVNNPTTYTTLGINEESDAVLKVRRQKSVSLSSQGYLSGLLAALENINGVTSAFVYENVTGTTDSGGVPGHSIWVIVAGTGADADIADAIYRKRNAGCGMFGAVSYTITQVDGSPFVVYWDVVATEDLFTAFTATSIDGVNPPDIAAILADLPNSFVPGVYEEVNINQLSTLVQAIDPNTLVTGAGFSLALTQVLTLSGVAASGSFKFKYNGNLSAAINWNDNIATIQAALRAVAGLSAVLVTGSIASQTLTINATAYTSLLTLITISNNSLLTGGSVAITFAYNEGYANTLLPLTKKNQFVTGPGFIIITPMVMSPPSATVVSLATKTFAALGGYGTKVYSLLVNNSGGSIDASTGIYTAGVTPNVVDTVKAVDDMQNSVTALVTVTT